MAYLDKAAIMCPTSVVVIEAGSKAFSRVAADPDRDVSRAARRPSRDLLRARPSLAGVRRMPSRSPALSVPKTREVPGTSRTQNRLRVSKPSAGAKGCSAVGADLERRENPTLHRPTEWERHHAR
jgi:hypothetical protein